MKASKAAQGHGIAGQFRGYSPKAKLAHAGMLGFLERGVKEAGFLTPGELESYHHRAIFEMEWWEREVKALPLSMDPQNALHRVHIAYAHGKLEAYRRVTEGYRLARESCVLSYATA